MKRSPSGPEPQEPLGKILERLLSGITQTPGDSAPTVEEAVRRIKSGLPAKGGRAA